MANPIFTEEISAAMAKVLAFKTGMAALGTATVPGNTSKAKIKADPTNLAEGVMAAYEGTMLQKLTAYSKLDASGVVLDAVHNISDLINFSNYKGESSLEAFTPTDEGSSNEIELIRAAFKETMLAVVSQYTTEIEGLRGKNAALHMEIKQLQDKLEKPPMEAPASKNSDAGITASTTFTSIEGGNVSKTPHPLHHLRRRRS